MTRALEASVRATASAVGHPALAVATIDEPLFGLTVEEIARHAHDAAVAAIQLLTTEPDGPAAISRAAET